MIYLKLEVSGSISKDGEGAVVALSGGTTDGRQALSMVFKHSEFIEVYD